MRQWLVLAVLLSGSAIAQEFTDAQVLNVEAKQGMQTGFLGIGTELQADNYTLVTVQLGDMKVSARTYQMGGGMLYLASHPEAMIVGSTIKAKLVKDELQVQVPPKGKVLKFKIERLEKT